VANFLPLKNHLLFCVDELLARHDIGNDVAGPFLDAGCGSGDVSLHLARKGWTGTAVDASPDAVARARALLAPYPDVRVEQGSAFGPNFSSSDAPERADFALALAMDVIEHLEDDAAALSALAARLRPGGHLVVSVPSNPREWRWDDEVFGHYRRYTEADLRAKLRAAGFVTLEIWDFTFPVFWAMRRAYTRLKPAPRVLDGSREERTRASSGENPWAVPGSGLLSRDNFLWRALSRWQFARHRHRLGRGHEFVALAVKAAAKTTVKTAAKDGGEGRST
jgi:SAM-dependent methyltransferase